MATDGPKIIHGDLANDIYWGFMDMYDGGVDIVAIKERYPIDVNYYDDFEYEIFITAYALALWEVGALSEDILDRVKTTIDKGVGEISWAESHGQKAGTARKKEMHKFWEKIGNPNLKIRKREKYRLVTKTVFDQDDVLVFQLPDGNYCITILLTIHQYRGQCDYRFGKILFNSPEKPAIEDVSKLLIAGNNIPSLVDPMPILEQGLDKILEQGGLNVMLKNEALRTGQFISALNQTSISHVNISLISNRFENIGQIKIHPPFKYISSLDGARTFVEFCEKFMNLESDVKQMNGDWFVIEQLVYA